MYQKRNSSGHTLPEMMIGLFISLLLITGAWEIYLAAEKSSCAAARVQAKEEKMQLLSSLVRKSLHMAGFAGCMRFPVRENFIETTTDPAAIAATDVLTVWHAAATGALLAKRMRGKSVLYVQAGLVLHPSDSLVISDCLSGEVVKIKNILPAGKMDKIILQAPLQRLYPVNTEILRLERETFFVGSTSRVDEKGNTVTALFLRNLQGEKNEIVEGITGMRIFYDLQTGDTLTETASAAMHQPSAVRGISMLLDMAQLPGERQAKKIMIYAATRNHA
jgi:type II secretory pathway component PulJ